MNWPQSHSSEKVPVESVGSPITAKTTVLLSRSKRRMCLKISIMWHSYGTGMRISFA